MLHSILGTQKIDFVCLLIKRTGFGHENPIRWLLRLGGRQGEKEMNGIQISCKQTLLWNPDYISAGFQLGANQLFFSVHRNKKNHKVFRLPGDNTEHSKKENLKPLKIIIRSLKKWGKEIFCYLQYFLQLSILDGLTCFVINKPCSKTPSVCHS